MGKKLAIVLLVLVLLIAGGAYILKLRADDTLAKMVTAQLAPLQGLGFDYRLQEADALHHKVVLTNLVYRSPTPTAGGLARFSASSATISDLTHATGRPIADVELQNVELATDIAHGTAGRVQLLRADLGGLELLATAPSTVKLPALLQSAEATDLTVDALGGQRLTAGWVSAQPRPRAQGCVGGAAMIAEALHVEGATMLDPSGLFIALGPESSSWNADTKLDFCNGVDGMTRVLATLRLPTIAAVGLEMTCAGLEAPALLTQSEISAVLSAARLQHLHLTVQDLGGIGQVVQEVAAGMSLDRISLADSATGALADTFGPSIDDKDKTALAGFIAASAGLDLTIDVPGEPIAIGDLSTPEAQPHLMVNLHP